VLCGSNRGGSPQGFRLDLKSGEMKQITQAEGLDASTLTLLPDNRSFCYLAGRSLYVSLVSSLRSGSSTKCRKAGNRPGG